MKNCKTCDESLPDTTEYFYARSDGAGTGSECKACVRTRSARRSDRTRDLRGHSFGKLLVLGNPELIGRVQVWMCLCECGQHRKVKRQELLKGIVTTCEQCDHVEIPPMVEVVKQREPLTACEECSLDLPAREFQGSDVCRRCTRDLTRKIVVAVRVDPAPEYTFIPTMFRPRIGKGHFSWSAC